MMHAAGRAKPFTGAFQHDALASGHIAQRQQLCPIHHAGIGMGQQPGFTQHQITHGHQVFDGAGMAHFRQGVARLAPAQFGLIAQRKQRFRATCLGAGTRNRQHFVWRQIRRTSRTGFFGEGAVMADIAAELGQRNEDLARIGQHAPMPCIAQSRGFFHQFRQWRSFQPVLHPCHPPSPGPIVWEGRARCNARGWEAQNANRFQRPNCRPARHT